MAELETRKRFGNRDRLTGRLSARAVLKGLPVVTDSILQQLECLERAIGNLPEVPEDVSSATASLRSALARWPRDPSKGIVRVLRREQMLILPNGSAIEFGRRRALRPIVFALIEARRNRPGVALSGDEIIAIAWPEMAVRNACTTNRLWVAMARLRQLGLVDYLITTKHGWMLTPTVEFVEQHHSDIHELRPTVSATYEEEVEPVIEVAPVSSVA